MMVIMAGSIRIGEAEISTLAIGEVRRTLNQLVDIFPTVDREELRKAIGIVQPDSDGRYLDWYFNAVLIRIPNQTILVDTGFGLTKGDPGRGTSLLLSELGVAVEEVDTVVITHGHGDHIGGLTEQGAPAFPDATVVLSRQEYEFWMAGKAERYFGAEASAAQRNALSLCARQIECVDMDSRIAESAGTTVWTLPAPGHTPGHIGIAVHSQGKRLWLLVDAIHALFQLQHPRWSPSFDIDPAQAEATRMELLEHSVQAGAEEGLLVHVYHFPYPAFGCIEATEGAFSFKAADP
jgi:glyoxylase-like metal-dependent hydrolase (beta-lactamase superfamily II)